MTRRRKFANFLAALAGYLVVQSGVMACAASELQLQACDATHSAKAMARRDAECPTGSDGWLTCPARPDILKELEANMTRCSK